MKLWIQPVESPATKEPAKQSTAENVPGGTVLRPKSQFEPNNDCSVSEDEDRDHKKPVLPRCPPSQHLHERDGVEDRSLGLRGLNFVSPVVG